jgi:hypothetical protein
LNDQQPPRLVFIDVVLTNTGQRRIDASTDSPSKMGPRFEASIRFAGSLQLRKVSPSAPAHPSHIDWWNPANGFLEPQNISETDLFKEYSDQNGRVEFFMEPGEKYNLGNAFYMEPGTYLAKVVIVGQRKDEYWGRIVKVEVP